MLSFKWGIKVRYLQLFKPFIKFLKLSLFPLVLGAEIVISPQMLMAVDE